MAIDKGLRDKAIQEKRDNKLRSPAKNTIPLPNEAEIKDLLKASNIWIPDDIIHNWWLQKKGDTSFWHERPIQDWFYNLQWFSHNFEMKAKFGNEGLGSKEVFKRPAPIRLLTPEEQKKREIEDREEEARLKRMSDTIQADSARREREFQESLARLKALKQQAKKSSI